MGTWGHGMFEGDSALDFMEDLEEADDLKATIKTAFESVLDSGYPESDEGTAVVVAAAYVDRQVNGTTFSPSGSGHPLPVDTFPNRRPAIDLTDLKTMAVKALRRVLGDNSELKALWEESGELEEWRSELDDLILRLSR